MRKIINTLLHKNAKAEVDASTIEGFLSLTKNSVLANLTGNIYSTSNCLVYFTDKEHFKDHLASKPFCKSLARSIRERSRAGKNGSELELLAHGIENGRIKFFGLSEVTKSVIPVTGLENELCFAFTTFSPNLVLTLEIRDKIVTLREERAYPFGREGGQAERQNDILLAGLFPEEWKFMSRTQGTIEKKDGLWKLYGDSRPLMSISGYGPLDLGQSFDMEPEIKRSVSIGSQKIFDFLVHEDIPEIG